MKFLILLFICLSCQKHIMPKEKDLYDIDADGVHNEYDANPNLVDIPDFDEVSGRISFYTENKSIYHQFDIESSADLENYLYRNLFKKSLQHDYFSEETLLRVDFDEEAHKLKINEEKYTLVFQFQPNHTPPKSIYISYSDKDYFLANWSEKLEVAIPGPALKDLISGKARLNLEYAEWDRKKIQEIKKMNKRVIYQSADSIEVMYVTKKTSLPQILSMLNLKGAKDLNQINLLKTQINNDHYTWAKEKDDTVFVIDGSLKEIYENLLINFEKHEFIISRTNGKLDHSINIQKKPNGIVIFKYVGKKTDLEFKEYKKDSRIGGGGKEGSHDICTSHYRSISKTTERNVTSNEFENFINMNKSFQSFYADHKEIAFSDELNKVTITNEQLPDLKFVTLGVFSSPCKEASNFKQANEGYLKVKVEAYIEKN